MTLTNWQVATTAGYELNCKPIPYGEIIRLFAHLPSGHKLKWPLMLLFLTGCRPSELQKMSVNGHESFLRGNYLFWRVGKNQGGQWRREWLPDYALVEFESYKRFNRVWGNSLVGISAATLHRYFNRDVRPALGASWQLKSAVGNKNGITEYLYQVKSFRKDFASLVFYGYYKRWGDAGAAVEFTCKRMRHSNKGITVQHYLSNVECLDMERWGFYTPAEILGMGVSQTKLEDYTLALENRQSRMQDFIEE